MQPTIHEVALSTPVTISPEASILEAEQCLIASQSDALFIVDDQERLLGTVTQQMLLQRRLGSLTNDASVDSFMQPVPQVLAADATLESAVRLLSQNDRGSVPVVQQERLIGQLSRGQLLRSLSQMPDLKLPNETHAATPVPAPKLSIFAQFAQAAFSKAR